MSCRPGDPCYSTLGRNVYGRSTAGYDYRPVNTYGMGSKANMNVMNGAVRTYGVPKTEAQRRATHYTRYGNSNLPPRGTGRVRNASLEGEFSWGTLFAGIVVGGILGYLLFAESGRAIGYAAGRRVARKVKG